MRLVARKAQGSRRVVAQRKPSTVSADAFAKAFDAKPKGSLGDDTNPLTLLHLRSEFERLLRSSGGRPSLAGSADKWKVGILKEDAEKIKELAASVATDRYKPSPAQIASLLIRIGLDTLQTGEAARRFKESPERFTRSSPEAG